MPPGSIASARRVFFGTCALLFAASAALTIAWCGAMSAMGARPMPGGWTLSMAWLRMPGQGWPHMAASFLAMWGVMMVAMMLTSLAPTLWRYRQAVGRAGPARPARCTVFAAAGYFCVWSVVGLGAWVLGMALAALALQSPTLARAVPAAAAAVVLVAGALQFSAYKARQLACCRALPGGGAALAPGARAAWRHGLRLGLHCVRCCAGLMAALLAVGVMDLRAMALVAAAITLERLAPAGERAARAIGAIAIGAGALLLTQALLA